MAERIEVTIDENGGVTYEGFGFKGNGCVKAMGWLEGLGKVIKRVFTGGKKDKKVQVSA